ncbi:MAG: glycosyl transferase family 2, partial [Flavobacteriaceae bacterium]|nr:glycosyl transferase family 2 [Flavobacteriaceae bacterium]
MLFKTKDFIRIKGFDERYFLYMEDIDICKKIDAIGKKKLYYPYEQIFHDLNRESRKNFNAFFYHITSIFQYFYKWKFAK